jgi:hypothetical protein
MKKLLICLAVLVLLALGFGRAGIGRADVPVPPSVASIEPTSAFNDIDTRVTITGTGFAASDAGTATASLGGTALTDVAWVDTQTLTATVPWGMDAGTYPLTVANPDGGTTTLTAAFSVTQGIGQWNSGKLFGAQVRQLLMKPGDPNTLYALAYDVGMFRSIDAGEHWIFTHANVIGNADFVIDPSTPGRLYSVMSDGLRRSDDDGQTWPKMLFSFANDTSPRSAEAFVSPHDPNVLFLGSYQPYSNGVFPGGVVKGLQKSVDGGAHWTPVASMEGTSVQSVAFDPADPTGSHMVLATADARIFTSSDTGDTWTEVAKPPAPGLEMDGSVSYNPFKSGEVWVATNGTPARLFKSNSSALTGWTDVTPTFFNHGTPSFVTTDTVYVPSYRSTNDGTTWQQYGPSPWWGGGVVTVSPDDTRTIYIGDATVGVQKSTDGGLTWVTKNQGLQGMSCLEMNVSRTDPLRVYASFWGWPGLHRSDDGTTNWTYLSTHGSTPDVGYITAVREDPFDPGRIYEGGGTFAFSRDKGETWTDLGWNLSPALPPITGGFQAMAADPHHAGHLIASFGAGSYGNGPGWVYFSIDSGAHWQAATMSQEASQTRQIIYDPETTGTIYLTTMGTGVFRSTDDGAHWYRVGAGNAEMDNAKSITIATHPRHVVLVGTANCARSFDGGTTWEAVDVAVGYDNYLFVDGDSTRLYSFGWEGMGFSSNIGNSWTRAAGALGRTHTTSLAYANADGHTILYAATTGGDMGAPSAVSAAGQMAIAAVPPSTLVGAGIYRKAQVETTATFTSSGSLDGWVLESRHTSSAGGTVSSASTTLRLGDNASKKQYRSILSFTTGAALPDSAVITKVTLKVRKQGVTGGGDPVSKFQGFMLDLKKGYFGTSSSLRASDFQARASKSYGPLKPAAVSGWYTFDLTDAKAYVNKASTSSGRTQIRLRFHLDDNNNWVANYLRLYSGNASAWARPQLVVTYYVP